MNKPLSECFYLENEHYVCTFGRWQGWGMNNGHISFLLWCQKNLAKTDEDKDLIDTIMADALSKTTIYRSKS